MYSNSYDKQKEEAGKFATFVWIASGLYLYISSETASLFSWSAVSFFFIGMFVAALFFGIVFYLLQRLTAKILMKIIPESITLNKQALMIKSIGVIIMLVEIIVIFMTAQWAFHHFNNLVS